MTLVNMTSNLHPFHNTKMLENSVIQQQVIVFTLENNQAATGSLSFLLGLGNPTLPGSGGAGRFTLKPLAM